MSRGILAVPLRGPALCARSFVVDSRACGRIAPRDGVFARIAYGVPASCCAHGSSEAMEFVRVSERRMASSLVSGRLRRDIMSVIVVGGMGMDTWRPLRARASRDLVLFISNARSSRSAAAFSILIALRHPCIASAPSRLGAPLNARVLSRCSDFCMDGGMVVAVSVLLHTALVSSRNEHIPPTAPFCLCIPRSPSAPPAVSHGPTH